MERFSPLLFEKDWLDRPGAVLDLETSNRSAVNFAYKLKAIGIKNHAFFLVTYNPELVGVDPHSPDLTRRQKFLITKECNQNPWYVLRNVLRAPAQAGAGAAPIEFNRSIICLWWCFFNHVTICLTQIRQTGKTFGNQALKVVLSNFICRDTKMNLLTKDDALRRETLLTFQAIYDELPTYLKYKTSSDTWSNEAISIKLKGNRYNGRVPSSSPTGANRVGRGFTTNVVDVDEGPFQPHIDISMDAITGGMGAAVDLAKSANAPYGLTFTTTAGDMGDPSGKFSYDFVMRAATWSEAFYDAKDSVDLETIVTTASPIGAYRIYAVFNHRQLGKTDAWLLEQLRRKDTTADRANRDFFNVWTNGSSSSPIAKHVQKKIAEGRLEPAYDQIAGEGRYLIHWYVNQDGIEHHMATRATTLGMDASTAIGKDAIALYLNDILTGETIATANISLTNIHQFSVFIADFLIHYKNVTFVPERHNMAIAIIDYLLKALPAVGIDPFKRIFNLIVQEQDTYRAIYDDVICKGLLSRTDADYNRAKFSFGYPTAGSGSYSRDMLYSGVFTQSLDLCSGKLRDPTLCQQLLSLSVKGGRIDHATSGHDDMVIAYLLTHWFFTNGKGLSHYGIDPLQELSGAHEKPVIAAKDAITEYRVNLAKRQLDAISQQLEQETNPDVIGLLENKLRATAMQIPDVAAGSGIDVLLINLAKRRKEKRRDSMLQFRRGY